MLCSAQANSADRFEELYCLAKNIYFESRNQPTLGQIAVGQVTMNRVNSPKFPNTVMVNQMIQKVILHGTKAFIYHFLSIVKN